MPRHVYWTEDKIEWLKNNAKGKMAVDVTKEYNETFNENVTVKAIKNQLAKYHIHLEIRAQLFPKGHEPWNKGKHGVQKNIQGKYQKGNVPASTRPIGFEREEKGFIFIKTAMPNTWRLKHHVVWEEHNGPIPPKHRVIFLDNNHFNCDISNLMLLTEAEACKMQLNHWLSNNPEITKAYIELARFQLKVVDIEQPRYKVYRDNLNEKIRLERAAESRRKWREKKKYE